MSNLPRQGRFVWYELTTPDCDAARAFYSDLFGWDWRTDDMGEIGAYHMAHTGDAYHGGLISSPSPDIPAQWLAYVTVPDVDRAAETAAALGGKVVVPPTDIPHVGRFAGLLDPAGAAIHAFRGQGEAPPEVPDRAPAGFFCWRQLLTTHPAACEPFYREIFGWRVTGDETPASGEFWLFHRGETTEGGMMPLPPQAAGAGAPSHWLPYVAVDDLDAALARVAAGGGSVHCRPTDVPDMGRFAVIADPQGASLALWKHG